MDVEQKVSEWKPSELREDLKARGITLRRLALAAGEHPSNLSDALLGIPVGPMRRARITAAARRLLDDSDDEES